MEAPDSANPLPIPLFHASMHSLMHLMTIVTPAKDQDQDLSPTVVRLDEQIRDQRSEITGDRCSSASASLRRHNYLTANEWGRSEDKTRGTACRTALASSLDIIVFGPPGRMKILSLIRNHPGTAAKPVICSETITFAIEALI